MTLHTYRTGGSGLPLVLLHGFPLDHRMWDAAAELVPGERPVLAVDLPGTISDRGELPGPSIEASADRVASTLRAAGIDRAVVAGLSMGGFVVLALLERHPDLVAGAGLVSTKSTADGEEARAKRLRIADESESGGTVAPVRPMAATLVGETTRSARPDIVATIAAWIDEQRPDGIAWSQRAMAARPDRTEVLRGFAGPVLVVVGDEDTATPVEAAEHMLAAAQQAVLVVVPHAGHMTALEEPGSVADALAELAQRADTGSSTTA
ncbi:alpha/beta fold hydrolase [Cellulomonas sp. URHB0016]